MEDSDRGDGGLPELVDRGVEAASEKRDFEVGVGRVGEGDDADSPTGPKLTEERAARGVNAGREETVGVVDVDRTGAHAETLPPPFGSPVDGDFDHVAGHVLPNGVYRSPKGLSPKGNIPQARFEACAAAGVHLDADVDGASEPSEGLSGRGDSNEGHADRTWIGMGPLPRSYSWRASTTARAAARGSRALTVMFTGWPPPELGAAMGVMVSRRALTRNSIPWRLRGMTARGRS